VAALVFLSLPALATAAALALPIKGTYTTTVSGSKWTISIAPSGRYGIYNTGRKLVTGSVRVTGKRVAFVDQGGPRACRGAVAVGIYRWQLTRGLLTLTPLSERCSGRRVVLSTRPLLRR
jgi:hypothetical protein